VNSLRIGSSGNESFDPYGSISSEKWLAHITLVFCHTLLKRDVLGQFMHLVGWYHAEFCPASILVYSRDLVNPTIAAVVIITTVTCITCQTPTAISTYVFYFG
jgi:hypothetical protein